MFDLSMMFSGCGIFPGHFLDAAGEHSTRFRRAGQTVGKLDRFLRYHRAFLLAFFLL